MINRPSGMSQLDWLWTNYGDKKVSNEVSKTPSNEVILTEKGFIDYITSEINKLDISMEVKAYEEDNNIVLEIISGKGVLLSKVSFQKGVYITKFDKKISTQEDVDKGISTKVGSLYFTLQDSIGQEYNIDLSCLDYIGQDTDSINIFVKDRKIAGKLKINNPIVDKSVDIKNTPDGIKAELIIDQESDSAITITKSDRGVSCHYKWNGNENEIKFKVMTIDEYLTLSKVDYGALYFITDLPCIYFRGIKYGSATSLIGYVTEEILDDSLNDLKDEIIGGASEGFNSLSKIENKMVNHINNLWWEE